LVQDHEKWQTLLFKLLEIRVLLHGMSNELLTRIKNIKIKIEVREPHGI
jgi:hypothetical protein